MSSHDHQQNETLRFRVSTGRAVMTRANTLHNSPREPKRTTIQLETLHTSATIGLMAEDKNVAVVVIERLVMRGLYQ